MLSKKNLWYLTLFSIILCMAVYYISTPTDTSFVNKVTDTNGTDVTVNESSGINSLKISRDESLEKEVSSIKEILLDQDKTTEEKSDAYEALKQLNANKGKEETLEKYIKKNFNYENFIKIDGSNVKVVINSKEHSYELANKIINVVQKEFDNKMYITVSFESM